MRTDADPLRFSDLSLARRTDLFREIAALDPGSLAPAEPAVFGEARGWIVSDMKLARSVLAKQVGVKSRPDVQQAKLGGIGAMRGPKVRQVKSDLIRALNALCQPQHRLTRHVEAAMAMIRWGQSTGPLTEALTASTITLATDAPPGSLDGNDLRRLVAMAWGSIEQTQSSDDGDGLLEFLRSRLSRRAPIIEVLNDSSWTVERAAQEMRAMLLAGWGSTSAAALSSIALGVADQLRDRRTLDEVLRLYPPSFMIARKVISSSRSTPFALGDTVVVSPWLIHRSPYGWEDPLAFNSERWANRPDRPWFLPFGLGPRRCPAAAFARAQCRESVKYLPRFETPTKGHSIALVEGRSPALLEMGWTVESIYSES